MARFFRGLNFGLISAVLLITFLFNLVIFLKNSEDYQANEETNEEEDRRSEEDGKIEVIGHDAWLKLPVLSNEDPLLLGKSSPKKVKLAIGMLLSGDTASHASEVINEIIRQDPKPDGSRSLVIVLFLNEYRRSKMELIFKIIKEDLSTALLDGYVQLIISPFDSNLELFEVLKKKDNLNKVPDRTAKMNLQLSFLINYCSDVAKNILLVDNDMKPIPKALKTIYNEMDKISSKTSEVRFGDSMNGRLFTGKYMPRVSALFHCMAFLGYSVKIVEILNFASVYEEKVSYKGEKMFSRLAPSVQNPPATIATTMKEVGGKRADDAYMGKDFSWFSTPAKGETFTMTFKNAEIFERVVIETGMDSFHRDTLVEAVLEFSYEWDERTKQCVEYKFVKSFEETSSVEIVYDDENERPLLLKPIYCIRIKVTKDQGQWCAIRTISIVPR